MHCCCVGSCLGSIGFVLGGLGRLCVCVGEWVCLVHATPRSFDLQISRTTRRREEIYETGYSHPTACGPTQIIEAETLGIFNASTGGGHLLL